MPRHPINRRKRRQQPTHPSRLYPLHQNAIPRVVVAFLGQRRVVAFAEGQPWIELSYSVKPKHRQRMITARATYSSVALFAKFRPIAGPSCSNESMTVYRKKVESFLPAMIPAFVVWRPRQSAVNHTRQVLAGHALRPFHHQLHQRPNLRRKLPQLIKLYRLRLLLRLFPPPPSRERWCHRRIKRIRIRCRCDTLHLVISLPDS